MSENNKDVHIDYQTMFKQFTDKIITNFMLSIIPDENARKLITNMVAIHRKYGIDAATSIKIITELAEIMQEEK